MTVDQIQAELRNALVAGAAGLGLRAERLEVRYVLNLGGFVNHSFHVSDGTRRVHVKLAAERDGVAKLERWRRLHGVLEERYHAPPMLGWIELSGAAVQGPVFAHLEGRAPAELTPALRAELAPMLTALHADRELSARLDPLHNGALCSEVFFLVYGLRFRGDLEILDRSPPPFITPGTLRWMQREAEGLLRAAETLPAFRQLVLAPIHGDLWINNLLVGDDGRWWVLDWDDLGIGDPALDWAMLLGPTLREVTPARVADLPPSVAGDELLRARFALYARASLLDWVIDPLADWVEAGVAPEHAESVRATNRSVHERALERYRSLYPAPG
jgi:hypothetical protein